MISVCLPIGDGRNKSINTEAWPNVLVILSSSSLEFTRESVGVIGFEKNSALTTSEANNSAQPA